MKKWVRALLIAIWLAPAIQFIAQFFYYMIGFRDMYHPFIFKIVPDCGAVIWFVMVLIWMFVSGQFYLFALRFLEES